MKTLEIKCQGIPFPLEPNPGFWHKTKWWRRLLYKEPKWQWVPPLWETMQAAEKMQEQMYRHAIDELTARMDDKIRELQ